MQDYIEQVAKGQEGPYYADEDSYGAQYAEENLESYQNQEQYTQEQYYQQQEYNYQYDQRMEQDRKDREYANYLRDFMTDFEPSDQLTVEIEAQATQSYQIRVTQVPSIIKLVIAVVNED